MCDIDYVAALYVGWDGIDRRKIATGQKTIRFLEEVIADAAERQAYRTYARHLYDMYRVGTVHLREPKIVVKVDESCTTPALTWALMQARRDFVRIGAESYSLSHLEPIVVRKRIANFPEATMLPVSIQALFDDFLSGCEVLATRLVAALPPEPLALRVGIRRISRQRL